MNAINAVRKVTIESARSVVSEVNDFDNSVGVMDRVTAKDKEKLPAIIEFICTPYNGLAERVFTVRTSINISSAEPRFTLRIVALEQQKEDIAEEFKILVESKLKELPVNIFIGELHS